VDGRSEIAIWGAQAASLQLPAACRQYVRTSESDSGKICFGKLPKPAGWQPALPNPKTEKEMPDRASLAIRHLVDVQLAAAKTELCVTVVFFELWFLSIPKSLRHVPLDDQLIHPKDLAVDLCLRAIRNSKVESRKLRGLNF